jgi:hypothetical protein
MLNSLITTYTLQTGTTRVKLREPECLQVLARTVQNLPLNIYLTPASPLL